ncbi:MAG: SpoIIE family protein phosphatase [Fuerstiella sp.]|nr:SpoIIE family protein phosphatase [Fuerstiella sp.]
MAVLQQVFGEPPLPSFSVQDDITTIGRHEDCNVVVASPAVSRFHTRITCEDNRFFVEDLGSRNGTLVNGQPVRERTPLNDGDQVEVSTLPFTFITQDSLAEAFGSWGVKAKVVSVSETGSDNEDSVRRRIVAPGDCISKDDLGTDIVREGQIVARMLVTNAGAWPVLTDATLKLNHVLRMIHGLRRTIELDDVISRALQHLFEVFQLVERIAVVLRNEHGNDIGVAAAVSRRADEEVQICLPVVRHCMQNTEAMLYVDHWKDTAAGNSELDNPAMRSIMCVPLIGLVGHSIGAIQIDSRNARRPLDKQNLEQLVVVSHVISAAMEQAAAAEAEVARAVLETNVASAERLRSQLAPSAPPQLDGYRVAHELIPAPDLATDLIDYVALPDGRIACLLLEAPGRGADASDLMALLARQLIGAVTETGSTAEALRQTEQVLSRRLEHMPTLTSIAVMILDPGRSSVTVSVAGHCSLTLIQGNRVTEIDAPDVIGPPLTEGSHAYLESEFQLNENDVILLASDGITKVTSPTGEILTRPRKVELIEEAATAHRTVFESRLRRLLNVHRGDAPLVDDVAFLVVHRTGMCDTMPNPPPLAVDSETQDT